MVDFFPHETVREGHSEFSIELHMTHGYDHITIECLDEATALSISSILCTQGLNTQYKAKSKHVE